MAAEDLLLTPQQRRDITARRRAVQPLWNAFDLHLKAHLERGVWLAVSGGPDSMALMESAARWSHRTEGVVGVISIDHSTRPEAESEADFVAARARVLGFDAQVVRVTAHSSDEASLRQARYDAFGRVLSSMQAKAICTAHHRDDDAEGFLMDMLGWGGGRSGAAMPARTRFGEYTLLRPFVSLGREDLRVALGYLNVKRWVVDPEDARRAGKRAFVRHEIVPHLERCRAHSSQRLGQRAARVREQEEYFAFIGLQECEKRGDGYFVPRRPQEKAALVRREIHEILRRMSAMDPRRAGPTIDRLLDAAGYLDGSIRPGLSFDLPGCRAQVLADGVLLVPGLQRHLGDKPGNSRAT